MSGVLGPRSHIGDHKFKENECDLWISAIAHSSINFSTSMASMSRCLRNGAIAGLGAGAVLSAYLFGAAGQAEAINNPACFCIGGLGCAALVGGPVVGGCAGGTYYVSRRFVSQLSPASRRRLGGAMAATFVLWPRHSYYLERI